MSQPDAASFFLLLIAGFLLEVACLHQMATRLLGRDRARWNAALLVPTLVMITGLAVHLDFCGRGVPTVEQLVSALAIHVLAGLMVNLLAVVVLYRARFGTSLALVFGPKLLGFPVALFIGQPLVPMAAAVLWLGWLSLAAPASQVGAR